MTDRDAHGSAGPATEGPTVGRPPAPMPANAPNGGPAPVGVGIVGCGNISAQYLETCRRFPALRLEAVADLDDELARRVAREHQVPRTLAPEALAADPAVDLVVNLTVPGAHASVTLAALEAGKAVYSEKPLATRREDGARLLEAARAHGARLGCAPDTFLGAAGQTARKLLDDGWIGRPLAATAFVANHGMEHWHPNPAFFFQPGAGPLFDIGVYYLTSLVALLGPVARVAGSGATGFPERTYGVGPRRGQRFGVGTPSHVSALLEFERGPVATVLASFDVWANELPRIEIYGTEGTLSLPDPNFFGGPVRLQRAGDGAFREVPHSHGFEETRRGLGAADLAHALRSGRPHRASGELAYHVLDVMEGVLESAEQGRRIDLGSRCERPAPLPLGLPEDALDDGPGPKASAGMETP